MQLVGIWHWHWWQKVVLTSLEPWSLCGEAKILIQGIWVRMNSLVVLIYPLLLTLLHYHVGKCLETGCFLVFHYIICVCVCENFPLVDLFLFLRRYQYNTVDLSTSHVRMDIFLDESSNVGYLVNRVLKNDLWWQRLRNNWNRKSHSELSNDKNVSS